ncbi:12531_t:CDS:2, partial [Ambispora gerdemannii]
TPHASYEEILNEIKSNLSPINDAHLRPADAGKNSSLTKQTETALFYASASCYQKVTVRLWKDENCLSTRRGSPLRIRKKYSCGFPPRAIIC